MTVQKVEIKDLGETVEVTQKSGVINEQAVTETLQNRQVLEHKFEKLSKKADAEVAVLKAKPQPSEGSDMVRPAVSALPTPLDNQISQVRLNQLWDSYCLAAPQAEDCRQGAQP